MGCEGGDSSRGSLLTQGASKEPRDWAGEVAWSPPSLIEIRAMDRETARRNMSTGLMAGGLATVVFALAFLAAFLYIAQA